MSMSTYIKVCGGSAVRLADLERWSQALGLSADGRAPGGSR